MDAKEAKQKQTQHSPFSSLFLFYQRIIIVSMQTHISKSLYFHQSKRLYRNECSVSQSKLVLSGFLRHRSATLIVNQCGHRNHFGCLTDNYRPRTPRAPCLCGCCYSDPQYGGRGEDLETQHHPGTQCRQ